MSDPTEPQGFVPSGEFYLGNGLYALFDGFHIKLRAPCLLKGDHEVYLDVVTWKALMDWRARAIPLTWTTYRGDF